MTDAACISYWYPKLSDDLGLLLPDTEIVTAEIDLNSLLDNKPPPGFKEFVSQLAAAVDRIGGFPCFMRTGHYSGKHEFDYTCRVLSRRGLPWQIARLVDESGAVDLIGLPVKVWAVREFLEVDSLFTAFRGNLPIAPEFRAFINGGRVACVHPYWPESAIRHPSDPRWREFLRAAYEEIDREPIREIAARVAERFPEFWSVDFAPVGGRWYLIDMAPGDRSYRPPDCPVCNPPEGGEV